MTSNNNNNNLIYKAPVCRATSVRAVRHVPCDVSHKLSVRFVCIFPIFHFLGYKMRISAYLR